ncbi:venom allergen 3-like [Temnothorax nylanderi]|uniref:venom allergen 3-like n=1 Tax=Temnothorax nylanderi TaxID=102681 RepID=UPI003A8B3BFB
MALILSILCLAIVAENFAGTYATDYCNLKFCKKIKGHTMCTYASPIPATLCRQWSSQGFNDAERKAIVEKHNQLRKKVASGEEKRGKNGPQPAAVFMPNLTWDKELEIIAQRWANQCSRGHDSCRNIERFSVGQNIASSSFPGINKSTLEEMIQSWYNEVANFDRRYISTYYGHSGEVGHYTQIVWADTTKIGCGRIKYKEPNGWTMHYLVCNYGPTGNVIGKKIYEIKK